MNDILQYSICSFCSLNMNYCNNGHLNNINDNISMFHDEWLLSHIEGAVGVTTKQEISTPSLKAWTCGFVNVWIE